MTSLTLMMTSCGICLLGLADAKLVSLVSFSTGIARIHNYYRKLEHASNMKIMVWDAGLARQAAEWSERCVWMHQGQGHGENMAYRWSTGTLETSDVIIRALKGWYNEKYTWNWSTYCGRACHYTQMVWADTDRVGCAYSVCEHMYSPSSERPVQNAHLFVCFYNPPGNYYGQYPFKYGGTCSQCDDDDTCQQGLCRDGESNHQLFYLPDL